MTHLPYIAASYGLTVVVVLWLSMNAWQRTKQARAKLAQIDPRFGAREKP
jgi:heme exporter protein CcmD